MKRNRWKISLRLVQFISAIWGLLWNTVGVAAGTEAFEVCDKRLHESPNTYASALCYYDVGVASNRLREAEQHLLALKQDYPYNYWLDLCLGFVDFRLDAKMADKRLFTAAEGFTQQNEVKGAVIARINLSRFLRLNRRSIEAAEEQLKLAEEAARKSQNSELMVRALVGRSEFIDHAGGDYVRVYRELQEALELSDIPERVRGHVQRAIMVTALSLGQYDVALKYSRDIEQQRQSSSDSKSHAIAVYNVAYVLSLAHAYLPDVSGFNEVLHAAQQSVETSVSAGSHLWEAASRALVAKLLLKTQPEEAKRQLEQCKQLTQDAKWEHWKAACLWGLARLYTSISPKKSQDYLQKATDVILGSPDRSFLPLAWRYKAEVAFDIGHFEEANRFSLEYLNILEKLRSLQVGNQGRADFFVRWAPTYYRFSGELLRQYQNLGDETYLASAFAIIERLRGRVLLDRRQLFQEGVAKPNLPETLTAEREAILEDITRLHRQHFASGEQVSAEHQKQRIRLERRESALRDKIYKARGSQKISSPKFVTLRQVQSLLTSEEALLSFQVGLESDLFGAYGGGGWLTVISNHKVATYPVPDRRALESMVPIFSGLFSDRHADTRILASVIYQKLLANALDALPESVQHLVIVPDGRLHELPFAALRATPEAEPLGARYQLSTVPSVTLWANWRQSRGDSTERSVYILADPSLDANMIALERSFNLTTLPGALPHAYAEGYMIKARLGGVSVLRTGADAHENALKTETRLHEYAVLHLATHAVIDKVYPDRSAILLAPGSEAEDGLLRPPEIIDLPLKDRVVMLSNCQSASGKLMPGEGVMGLAHAFFEAGARAVIASRWRLRDDDGQVAFDDIYTYLAQGESLASALQKAQIDSLNEGRPEQAWAGLVILGDGTTTPFPGGRQSPPDYSKWAVTTFLLLMGLFGVGLGLRKSEQPQL